MTSVPAEVPNKDIIMTPVFSCATVWGVGPRAANAHRKTHKHVPILIAEENRSAANYSRTNEGLIERI
jgi:hypothetical protein